MASGVLHSVRVADASAECASQAGTAWRANFYRMDYDDGKATQWEWARVGNSFHEYEKFGHLVFADR